MSVCTVTAMSVCTVTANTNVRTLHVTLTSATCRRLHIRNVCHVCFKCFKMHMLMAQTAETRSRRQFNVQCSKIYVRSGNKYRRPFLMFVETHRYGEAEQTAVSWLHTYLEQKEQLCLLLTCQHMWDCGSVLGDSTVWTGGWLLTLDWKVVTNIRLAGDYKY
jgi:hypothetical protein